MQWSFPGRGDRFHAIHSHFSDPGAERLWLRYSTRQILIPEIEDERKSNCQMQRYEGRVFYHALKSSKWREIVTKISRGQNPAREWHILLNGFIGTK